MSDPVTTTRTFLLRDAQGRNVDVVAQFGRHFSITSQHGAAHDEILAAAPADIRADIETLIAVHLCDHIGTPMHAIANAAYHLRQSNFDAACRSLGNVIQVEDLYRVFGEASRKAADPKLIEDYLKKPAAAAEKLMRSKRNIKDGVTLFPMPKQLRELTESIASMLGRRKIEDRELEDVAAGKFDTNTRERISESLKTKVFDEEVTAFAETSCRRIWKARAEAATVALGKPDYLVEGRPPIVDDPTTFKGFIAKWGLEMVVGPARMGNSGPESRRWTVEIRGREGRTGDPATEKVLMIDWGQGNPSTPDLERIIESLQTEFCSVINYDRDEWLVEFGFNGDMKELRHGESVYDLALEEQIPRFKEITGGDECFRDLLTSVGNDPPMDHEDYDAITGRNGPSPAR